MMLRAKGRVRNGILQLIIVDQDNRLRGYSKHVQRQESQKKPAHCEPLDIPSFMKKNKHKKGN